MKRLFCVGFALAGLAPVLLADYQPTEASWRGWTVQTGEDLWAGRRHTSYPVWNLFDGDPTTAWVYSGTFRNPFPTAECAGPEPKPFARRYWLVVLSAKPVTVDEIRIMNGYNKDRATFVRNARVTQLDLIESSSTDTEGRRIGRFSLDDTMGWQTIRIPRRAYYGFKLLVRSIVRGTDPDVAISELALLNRGRSVGPPKAKHIAFTDGSECG